MLNISRPARGPPAWQGWKEETHPSNFFRWEIVKSHPEHYYLAKKSPKSYYLAKKVTKKMIIFVITVTTYISIIIRPGDQKLLLRAADLRSRENLWADKVSFFLKKKKKKKPLSMPADKGSFLPEKNTKKLWMNKESFFTKKVPPVNPFLAKNSSQVSHL